MKRLPAVAGQFYHADPSRLTQQVEQYINKKSGKESAVGIVVPHAGLIYSGSVAGAVYSSIIFPKTFLMLGPNHTGVGAQISVMDAGTWEVPTGTVDIDRRLASRILQSAEGITRDSQAHMFEHSLEVQLPFMTHVSKEVQIVPVAIRSASFDECVSLAESIAHAVKSVGYPVTILASTDMSHYVPDRVARLRDKEAIEKILAIDPQGLYALMGREDISMCGISPTTIMLLASALLGAKAGHLVKYMTSAEASGDYDNVVGYAGIVLSLK
jgi:AmmeMemoRadiSam system protein B